MKTYEKPCFTKEGFSPADSLSSLDSWLSNNQLEGAGITTYTVKS